MQRRCRSESYRYTSGTVAVQYLAVPDFEKLRQNPLTTLPSAYSTYSYLLMVLLGLQRLQATHNPLAHGSQLAPPPPPQNGAGASTQPEPAAAPTPDYATASWLPWY